MPRFVYTDHALEQFVTRYERSLQRSEALRLLNQHSDSAQKMPDRTPRGQEQWLLPDLSVILITKLERGVDHVVTILAASVTDADSFDDFDLRNKPAFSDPEILREVLRVALRGLAKCAFDNVDVTTKYHKIALEILERVGKVDEIFLSYSFLSKHGAQPLSLAIQNGMARFEARRRMKESQLDD